MLGKRGMNIFKNNGNVELMLNESLNEFKFDSTHFHDFCYTFNNVERPVQTPPTFGSTKCSTHVVASVETI